MQSRTIPTRVRKLFWMAVVVLVLAPGCSPGTLPGTPSPVLVGGGGARYDGTVTVRRVGGNYTLNEALQQLSLALVVRNGQISGRFNAGVSSGTVSGNIDGNLAAGIMRATLLIATPAQQGGATTTCEGRGDVTATLSSVNLTWTANQITYDNCPGLSTASQAQAIAVSPIPGALGLSGRANLVISVAEGVAIRRSTCADGAAGYPFTVEIAETAGVELNFDTTFVVEERPNFGPLSTTTHDMPFTRMEGGGRRSYVVCSRTPGTYQAFFSGTDAGANRVRAASPIVTFQP